LAYSLPILPSPARRVLNFTRAAARRAEALLRRQPVNVAEEERQRRLAVCAACPLLLLPSRRCRHPDCGCWVEEKAGWATEECPENCWREPERLLVLQQRYPPPVALPGMAAPVSVAGREIPIRTRCCGKKG